MAAVSPLDSTNSMNLYIPSNAGARGASDRTIEVRNSQELQAALENAEPGTKILLGDGVYEGNFALSGKSDVTIVGSENAVLRGGDSGYTLHLENSNNITLTGFTVSGGQKGIMLDESNDNLLDGLTVGDTGHEGIHFRNNSSHNVLQNSFIDNTGLQNAGYGEGVYVGSDPSNIPNDHSNFNQIISNAFGPSVRAENVDIKEGTSGTIVRNNRFNVLGAMGENSGDSAVDVKRETSGHQISGNTTTGAGSGRGNITFEDGAEVSNSSHDNNWI